MLGANETRASGAPLTLSDWFNKLFVEQGVHRFEIVVDQWWGVGAWHSGENGKSAEHRHYAEPGSLDEGLAALAKEMEKRGCGHAP